VYGFCPPWPQGYLQAARQSNPPGNMCVSPSKKIIKKVVEIKNLSIFALRKSGKNAKKSQRQ
jgi:hypothetical protein